jgi:diaminopimelate epimerase
MPTNVHFTKMHGLGNDFIMMPGSQIQNLDLNPDTQAEMLSQFAIALCDRHFGVGADGLIFPASATEGSGADIRFVYVNSDGSRAEMCGNGIRCFALYVRDLGLVKSDSFVVETPAGLIRPCINADRSVTVDMGPPILEAGHVPFDPKDLPADARALRHIIAVNDQPVPITAIGMGNPHALIFQDELPNPLDPTVFGPLIERHSAFPGKTNVEFVQVEDMTHLKVTVWERGCGFTLACGTGACAAAVGAILLGKAENKVEVSLPGGSLTIEWNGNPKSSVLMSGPASYVFSGETLLSHLGHSFGMMVAPKETVDAIVNRL